jgi:hypothetical protein
VNETPGSQLYFDGILLHEVVPFRWSYLISTNITLDHTMFDRPKTFYGRTIYLYWNNPQGCLIYLQLSMFRTVLVSV